MNTSLLLGVGIGVSPHDAAAATGNAVGGTITLGLLAVFLIIGFIAVKAYKVKPGAMVLGACIGLLGSNSALVGPALRALISVVENVITSLATAIA